MKCLLITALITIFILALFSHSGSALRCFHCELRSCTNNVTCPETDDRCIIVYLGNRNYSNCWTDANCNLDYVANTFSSTSFSFKCCSRNLCNGSPIATGSKIVLGIASLLTIIQMLFF